MTMLRTITLLLVACGAVPDVMRTTDASPDLDHAQGHALLQGFVRGDALIGLMADVEDALTQMTSLLRSAANAGHAEAFADLGQCYAAVLVPIGAFDGVCDEVEPTWSAAAAAIVDDDNPGLQAALRCFFQAALLGHRPSASVFATWTRHANQAAQRAAAALLEALADDVDGATRGAEWCQLGYVHTWLQHHELALAALNKAAALGNGNAIFELSIVYGQGLGVDVDAAVAQTWLERAAEVDHPRALYNVGAGYASGRATHDGAPDFQRAASYYERAAGHGNGRAAAMLAIMILQAQIEGTTAAASSWLDTAEQTGFDTASLLDAVDLDDPRAS